MEEKQDLNTRYYEHCVSQSIDTVEDLQTLLRGLSSHQIRWKQYINQIVTLSGLSYEKFGKQTGFSKNTVKSWCRFGNMPQSREGFIKLGMGLRMNLEEINHLLVRYGQYGKLYPKSLEDAIAEFVIRQYGRRTVPNPYAYYCDLKTYYCARIRTKADRKTSKAGYMVATLEIKERLQLLNTEDEFEQFLLENRENFLVSYKKLVDFLETYLTSERAINRCDSNHYLLQLKQLHSGYEKMISKLRHYGEVPNRKKLITLGISLNLTLEEMNRMLAYAGMEPLCAKDKMEAVIMFTLINACLCYPDMEYEHAYFALRNTKDEELKAYCKEVLENTQGLRCQQEPESVLYGMKDYVKDVLKKLSDEDVAEMLSYFD